MITIVIVALFIFKVSSLHLPFFLVNNNCFGAQCLYKENSLKTLNYSVNPCENYYKYACDKWIESSDQPKSEPFWNQYTCLNYKIYERLRNLIEGDQELTNEKLFYLQCINQSQEDDNLKVFQEVINKLGGWKLIPSKDYNFFNHIIEVLLFLNINPVLSFHVDVDITNSTKRALYIQSGKLIFPEVFLINDSKEIKLYEEWIYQSLITIYDDKIITRSSIKEVIRFEIALAKLAKPERFEQIFVDTLPSINWYKIISIFRKFNLNLEDINYVISKPTYLINLMRLISNTPSNTISNYIVWYAVNDLSREVNSNLRGINFKVNSEIFEVPEDISRSKECVENSLIYFPAELTRKYLQKYPHKKTITKVSIMANNLKHEFVNILNQNKWLSNKTKSQVIHKISNVMFQIGYPTELFFTKVKLSNIYIQNILKLKNVKAMTSFKWLKIATTTIRWLIHPFEINAFYSTLQNTIILPIGILNPPFYDLSNSPLINYGALGSLIGHELSHALDSHFTQGVLLDDKLIYKDKLDCFKDLHRSFNKETDSSIYESLADSVGINLSYRVMRKIVKPNLFLNNYKLFFLHYAQMWCEKSNIEVNVGDEHAPVEIRVLSTLKHFIKFSSTYHCNYEEKCNLW